MKNFKRFAFMIACAFAMLGLASAHAAEDSRITYYKNQVHVNADLLRNHAKDLAAWQRNNWVAPRVCNGTALSWAKVPAGKQAALYDCAPFQCSTDGVCRQECSNDSNCAAGAKCLDLDASGRNGVCAAP